MHGLRVASEVAKIESKNSYLEKARLSCPSWQSMFVLCNLTVLVVALLEGWMNRKYQFNFALTPIYLIPITLMAWCNGLVPSLIIIVTANIATVAITMDPGHFSRHNQLILWAVNIGFDTTTMCIAALMTAEVRHLLDHEKVIARTDPITGINNTRSFWEVITLELERAKRFKRPISIAYLDIDDFKNVNDEQGHLRGDTLLKIVANTLKSQIRTTDIAARVGGDEFAICFPEATQESIRQIVERLKSKIQSNLQEFGFSNGLSIGVITFTSAPQNAEEMVHLADETMYKVKSSGKGRVEFRLS